MLWIIKVFIVVVALFAISRAFLRFKDRKVSFSGLVFWIALWTLAVVLAFAPYGFSYLADLVGIQRGTDFVVYLSIILLFYMIFRIYVKFEGIEQDLTKLTREIAMRRRKNKNSDEKNGSD